MNKLRLDIALTRKGLVKSRTRARELIEKGLVSADGVVVRKASWEVAETAALSVTDDLVFVGRGGLKLERALDAFEISVKDSVCADIGASTGGFTDCLLQRGAGKVYAIDAGHGQLAPSLLDDFRVVNLEKTNIRTFDCAVLSEPVEFVCSDVSFLSQRLVFPKIEEILKRSGRGQAVILLKPQFEAGPKDVGKGGIVRSPQVHRRILQELLSVSQEYFSICSLIPSPITGGDGNIEYLLHLRNRVSGGAAVPSVPVDINAVVREAFSAAGSDGAGTRKVQKGRRHS